MRWTANSIEALGNFICIALSPSINRSFRWVTWRCSPQQHNIIRIHPPFATLDRALIASFHLYSTPCCRQFCLGAFRLWPKHKIYIAFVNTLTPLLYFSGYMHTFKRATLKSLLALSKRPIVARDQLNGSRDYPLHCKTVWVFRWAHSMPTKTFRLTH